MSFSLELSLSLPVFYPIFVDPSFRTPYTRSTIMAVDGSIRSTGSPQKQRTEYRRKREIKFICCSFLQHLDRMRQKDYVPTLEDILKSRVPTSGVVQFTFFIKNYMFKVFDVGGQKSQRRKWIHIFDDVHAVLFITSLSEYNQVLSEDRKQEYRPALNYITRKFKQVNKNVKRTIYTHETCATDTQQIQVVIDSVIDVIIQQTMQKVGIQ
uniref:G-protein alpha subunit n=1 Tax=Heterorhabditis bacteriophora TaxID=37862 RepID=A0A1I7XET5_HETBA